MRISLDSGHAGFHRLGYDTAYVELALRKGLPMATKDETVRDVLNLLGVNIVGG